MFPSRDKLNRSPKTSRRQTSENLISNKVVDLKLSIHICCGSNTENRTFSHFINSKDLEWNDIKILDLDIFTLSFIIFIYMQKCLVLCAN